MEEMELISFNIIAAVGTARSLYMEAIDSAKQGDFISARAMIQEGDEVFIEGHHAHAELIQREAMGEVSAVQLLLIHAEDQLMSAETLKIVAVEIIELYERLP